MTVVLPEGFQTCNLMAAILAPSSAYDVGVNNWYEGVSVEDCPFEDEYERARWFSGWHDSESWGMGVGPELGGEG